MGVRVLREWVLARSAPASPLARASALHLLCRDAGFIMPGWHDGQAGCVLDAVAACICGCARVVRVGLACMPALTLSEPTLHMICVAVLRS